MSGPTDLKPFSCQRIKVECLRMRTCARDLDFDSLHFKCMFSKLQVLVCVVVILLYLSIFKVLTFYKSIQQSISEILCH